MPFTLGDGLTKTRSRERGSYSTFEEADLNGTRVPLPFFNTIKKLHPTTGDLDHVDNLVSARTTIWILVFFYPQIHSAVIGFKVTVIDDLMFLLEYSDTFKGKSNVKKLAIRPIFLWNDFIPDTWWDLEDDDQIDWMAVESQKSTAVSLFLEVTNQLDSLELTFTRREGDESLVNVTCLSSLKSSFGSLKHLRLAESYSDRHQLIINEFEVFKSLKILSVDWKTLGAVLEVDSFLTPLNLQCH